MTALKIVKKQNDENVKIVEPYKNKKLITVQDFAQMYGIGKTKAYTLANMEGFPCIKNGNKILILVSKVDKWLEDHVGLEF